MKTAGKKKIRRVSFRLTTDEDAAVSAFARERQMTRGAYIRSLVCVEMLRAKSDAALASEAA